MNKNWFSWKFLNLTAYAPDGKRGFYCKANQSKRRKMQRRTGKGR